MVNLKGMSIMKKAILYLCGIALLFAGCTKEQVVEPVVEETAPRHLTFDISVNYDEPETRAVKTDWESGDKVYLFFDLNAQTTTTVEYLTMTYDGTKWSYEFSNETLESTLLSKSRGSVFALYVPYGTPTFSYDGVNKRINIDGLRESKVAISYSYCRERLYTVENDKLTANLVMQLGSYYVQFFIPGITDASNLTFQCNQMTANIPLYISLSETTITSAGLTGYENEKVQGFIYKGGMVVCGRILAFGSSLDYSFTVTDNNGTTEDTNDDIVYRLSYTGKTLYYKDAVKLPKWHSKHWKSFYYGHEFVDLGDGKKWAVANMGAENPWDYGNHYAWGETEPKTTIYDWRTYAFTDPAVYFETNSENYWRYVNKYTFADGKTSGHWYSDGQFVGDGKKSLAEYNYDDDVVRQKWGGPWRMPTRSELSSLLSKYHRYYDDYSNDHPGKGLVVVNYDSSSPFYGNSIFLPCAGVYDKKVEIMNLGEYGYYWSSSIGGQTRKAESLRINPSAVFTVDGYYDRYVGMSIRAIAD